MLKVCLLVGSLWHLSSSYRECSDSSHAGCHLQASSGKARASGKRGCRPPRGCAQSPILLRHSLHHPGRTARLYTGLTRGRGTGWGDQHPRLRFRTRWPHTLLFLPAAQSAAPPTLTPTLSRVSPQEGSTHPGGTLFPVQCCGLELAAPSAVSRLVRPLLLSQPDTQPQRKAFVSFQTSLKFEDFAYLFLN